MTPKSKTWAPETAAAPKKPTIGVPAAERKTGPRSPAVLKGRVALGKVLLNRGAYQEAVRVLDTTVQMQQRVGSHDEDRADGLYLLGGAYYMVGDYNSAEKAVKASLAIHSARFGAGHPTVAEDESQLCSIDQQWHRMAEAEQHCKTAVLIDQRWYGPDSPVTATTMKVLVNALESDNKYAEAQPLLTQVLAIQVAAHGELHHAVADVLMQVGDDAYNSDDYAKAEDAYLRAQVFRSGSGKLDSGISGGSVRLWPKMA